MPLPSPAPTSGGTGPMPRSMAIASSFSSSQVPRPLAVRYAWAMNPSQRNLLYNREGFPASPFRTDDWPLYDPAAEVVTVDKPAKPDGYESVDWKRPEMEF